MIDKIRQHMVQYGPALLRIPVQLTPVSVQQKMMLDVLKQVFKESLEYGDFEFLEDRWLKVSVIDLGLHWFISYQDDQLVVTQECAHEDVSFSGYCNDFILIAARKEDPDTLFFQRRLQIEGDTELGLEVKNLMDSLDFSTLPRPLMFVLAQLAEFIQQGQQTARDHEVMHAH